MTPRHLVAVLLILSASAQNCDTSCTSGLCEGDVVASDTFYDVCYPEASSGLRLTATGRLEGASGSEVAPAVTGNRITVVSNYMSGCNAGRREASLFAYFAQLYADAYGTGRVLFLSGLKGESSCDQWAGRYESYAESTFDYKITDQPYTVHDEAYSLRDLLFAAPYHHPSYALVDGSGVVRKKFVGPCCGVARWSDCSVTHLEALNRSLTEALLPLLAEQEVTDAAEDASESDDDCGWGPWSGCPTCGAASEYREDSCAGGYETRGCGELPACGDVCWTALGDGATVEVAAAGFAGAKDVAFSPRPGHHLGAYSEGREFPQEGLEAWVVNSANHSVSIVPGLGTEGATTMSRRDRGYFHYMHHATALAFNAVSDSGRDADRDTFGSFATCQNSLNTYLDTHPPNYFMGPTLYTGNPEYPNLVTREGEECSGADACYFLHSDMLHEAPDCVGLAHDPELATAYGTVFWALDAFLGQLVRFDFQQPHGPGLMDHSYAAVRRFVDVPVRPDPARHAGMVVDAASRTLFVASARAGEVLRVGADSGSFARSARGGDGAGVPEYPAFSSRLPSFEYSVYECAAHAVFASGLKTPTGLALADGVLYVAEYETGHVIAFDVASGEALRTVATGRPKALEGLAIADGVLYAVDGAADELLELRATACAREDGPVEEPDFAALHADASCVPQTSPDLVNASLFEQVHADSGYLADDAATEDGGMNNEAAAALGLRTDCANLNLDALLLSGWMAHVCLPADELCDFGAEATAIQWSGYTCSNELHLDADGLREDVTLERGTTYRVTVNTPGEPLVISDAATGDALDATGVDVGPVFFTVGDATPALLSFGGAEVAVAGEPAEDAVVGDSSKGGGSDGANVGPWGFVAIFAGAAVLAGIATLAYATRPRPSGASALRKTRPSEFREETKHDDDTIVLDISVAGDDKI